MITHNVTITLSPKQADALLHAAQIGDVTIRYRGNPGRHKARTGAIRILERTIASLKAVDAAKATPGARSGG